MNKKIKIYFVSSMFNYREKSSNLFLTESLEAIGYSVYLPQRNGFVFQNLFKQINKRLSAQEALSAVKIIIYLLDVGVFLKESDIVLGIIDEPADEGVIIEMLYGKVLNKKIIGIRTDVRSPYGAYDDEFRGMHFFLPFQCDTFIHFEIEAKNTLLLKKEIKKLSSKIDLGIQNYNKNIHRIKTKINSEGINQFNIVLKEFEKAQILFEGLTEYNSVSSLQIITNRYLKNIKYFAELKPHTLI